MTSRRSSGSRRVAKGVDPTRSQNMMVSCRRSASAAALPSAACGGAPGWPPGEGVAGVGLTKLGNGFEQLAPVAHRRHADVLEIIGGQLRQHCPIDFVFPEGDLVSLETQAAQPRRYVHRRLPLALVYPPQPPGKIQFAAVLVVDLRLDDRPSR